MSVAVPTPGSGTRSPAAPPSATTTCPPSRTDVPAHPLPVPCLPGSPGAAGVPALPVLSSTHAWGRGGRSGPRLAGGTEGTLVGHVPPSWAGDTAEPVSTPAPPCRGSWGTRAGARPSPATTRGPHIPGHRGPCAGWDSGDPATTGGQRGTPRGLALPVPPSVASPRGPRDGGHGGCQLLREGRMSWAPQLCLSFPTGRGRMSPTAPLRAGGDRHAPWLAGDTEGWRGGGERPRCHGNQDGLDLGESEGIAPDGTTSPPSTPKGTMSTPAKCPPTIAGVPSLPRQGLPPPSPHLPVLPPQPCTQVEGICPPPPGIGGK